MRALPYNVTIYNCDDEPTSQCKYPTERAARKKYDKAVVSAECANVGRILLSYVQLPAAGTFGRFNRVKWENIAEWIKPVPEPKIQVSGYIVHSARSVNGKATSCRSVNKTFHETYEDAEQKARMLCDQWNDKHEGVIIFKAITHVHKEEYIPRQGIRIMVDNVE